MQDIRGGARNIKTDLNFPRGYHPGKVHHNTKESAARATRSLSMISSEGLEHKVRVCVSCKVRK